MTQLVRASLLGLLVVLAAACGGSATSGGAPSATPVVSTAPVHR